jgi:NDP-sugar pyrophosphorylase family protein
VGILAGGLGTRLHPITENTPKALLPIAGRPFIHWQLELLAEQGIEEVVLCVGYRGEEIRGAVRDGRGFGVRVHYSFDGAVALGTGGALKRALPLLGRAFFVLYGDSYLRCSFAVVQTAYEESQAEGLMTVFRNANRWEPSNLLFQGGRILEYNKRAPRPGMAHVDYGLGVLSARALERASAGSVFDLADLYHDLSVRGELAGWEVCERFYEIGSVAGMEETEHYLRAGTLR